VKRAFAGHNGVTDSQNCVSCHSLGEESLAIHSLPEAKLSSISESISARTENSIDQTRTSLLLKTAKLINSDNQQAPACSLCHQEHQGADANISQVSDQQCAVCHTNAFDDFASHTNFHAYPAEKRTQIIFSHNSHLNKHFAEDDMRELAPEACVDCHISDPIGRKMEVSGFEQTCSACHLDQVTGESRAGDKGFAMLSIPAIDVDSLSERGVDIGEWPAYSDAEFTPLNKFLVLAVNPALEDRMGDFSALDLYDLTKASEEQMQLVYDVAWTLKRVYFEMQRRGARAVSRRLSSIMQAEGSEAGDLFALLPAAVIDKATKDAFPNLESEMLEWLRQGKPEFTIKAATTPQEKPQIAVVAEPATGGEDDDWLSGALDDDEGDADDDWLSSVADESDDAEDAQEDDWLSAATEDEEVGDDDWLNSVADDSDDEDDWLSDVSEDSATAFDDDDIASEDQPSVTTLQTGLDVPESLSAEDRAAIGGWYYENYYLRYRPSGHADRLIVAWVERLNDSMQRDAGVNVELSLAMQRTLLGESTPGSCLKCHSVDSPQTSPTGIAKVHWFGNKTKPAVHDFNAFKHQSHFAVIDAANNDFASNEGAGCRSCHKINGESDSGVAYQDDANGAFESDFYDLEKEQCATCHEAPKTMASCTQCHNYHIGERGLTGIEDGFRSAMGAKTADGE
jgi:hypothetical protein